MDAILRHGASWGDRNPMQNHSQREPAMSSARSARASELLCRRRTDRPIQQIQRISAASLRGAPGRKSLILLASRPQNGTKSALRHFLVTARGESTMTYDPNNANDPNRPLNPNLDLRTTPTARSSNTWVVWVAALAVIAVAAFAYSQWSSSPGTSPDTTASTTQSEPAPAKPIAPTDNSATPAPAPAPATPPAAPAQQ
ncbi:hypothetical protein RHECIAT_CH0002857 [Rhizobium etli CIAT 652]|uniref:Transmembrane protein n=2 Tax=Rhizobium TaxID=379 RepID=B3PT63_RHIE6|nr:hypothetical protein RHECIAT_CH0002857 [Rhizobium etli CIAT 652]